VWIDKKNTNNARRRKQWTNTKSQKNGMCGLTRKIQTMREGGNNGLLQKAEKTECVD
jgi:hypothetical protein